MHCRGTHRRSRRARRQRRRQRRQRRRLRRLAATSARRRRRPRPPPSRAPTAATPTAHAARMRCIRRAVRSPLTASSRRTRLRSVGRSRRLRPAQRPTRRAARRTERTRLRCTVPRARSGSMIPVIKGNLSIADPRLCPMSSRSTPHQPRHPGPSDNLQDAESERFFLAKCHL